MGVGKGWGEEAERYSNSSWILAGVVLEPCLPACQQLDPSWCGARAMPACLPAAGS